MARPERVRLGDLLIQEALITAAQLDEALVEQKKTGRKLGRIFIDRQWVTEVQIARALARQLRAPFIDLANTPPSAELAALLPEMHARRLRALPIVDAAGTRRVAMADPTDLAAYDEVTRLAKVELDLAVVAETQLLAALDRVYRGGDEIAGLARELTSEIASVEDEIGDILGLTATTAEDAPVVRLLSSMFEQALRMRASDIHIEPQDRLLRIRFRIDGVLHVQTEADAKIAVAVALRLKLMSGLDISEKRLPQDGRFHVKLKAGALDVRISTLPTQHGESVVMRLLNHNAGLLQLRGMGLPAPLNAAIERALARPNGLILVTGPTGSGKTTTLYAALNQLNNSERKIITVEDPVEYRLPGLNQVQVMEKIDLSFARVLRAALRQDPDVILIGEMRDQNTAEIGLRAAMTGHLVLSTLHTNDALSTPLRLVDMGVPRYMVAMSLQLVLAQRLVRTLCPACAQPHTPEPGQLGWLRQLLGAEGMAPADVDAALAGLRAGRGCSECNHTGYSGRTGVYEFVEMTHELVEAMADDDPIRFMQAGRRQMAGATLRRDALRLALAGRTTLDEVMRVGSELD
ncbi:GspE/PulE family protein [Aquabacterium sp. OR-4]|uniref:GspE/PulE family protein n=1 Tax=Aquabacterium sp. OR-4 TaxID=2978127 RepID=UPI0021B36F74|nr:GspE/PulE family protein [Aquabacterium sp. OR-4]MDT7836885.1 GspE/PulE family protein [Aquabacterium sp. OR-4]